MRTRSCRACRRTRPVVEFILADDATAKARQWATRHWCARCLVKKGHVRANVAAARVRAAVERQSAPEPQPVAVSLAGDPPVEPVDPWQPASPEAAACVTAKVREHTLAVDLTDRALGDPVMLRAMERAVRAARQARAVGAHKEASPEAVSREVGDAA